MAGFTAWVIAVAFLIWAYVSATHHQYDYFAKPKYQFKYGVEDPKHGDHHSQWEQRDGDKVEGGYSLLESDGTWRDVTYTSDKKTGFNAVVHRHGKAAHPGHSEKSEHSAESRSGDHEGGLIDVGQDSYPDGAYGYVPDSRSP